MKRIVFFALGFMVFSAIASAYTADTYTNIQSTFKVSYTADTYTNIQSVFGSDEIVIDTTAPTYSLNSTNSTLAGEDVEHRLYWEDDVGLAGYIFSFCNGTWTGTDCTVSVSESVTVQLQDADTENLADIVTWHSSPSVTSNAAAMKFNISSLTDVNETNLQEALLYIYIYSTTGAVDADVNISRINNQSWIESTITLSQFEEFPLTNEDTSQSWSSISDPTWSYINLTDLLKVDLIAENDYFSFRFEDIDGTYSANSISDVSNSWISLGNFEPHKYFGFRTKEYTTDTSLRPYVNVTSTGTSSGGWVNSSWTEMTGTGNWSNVTKKINSTTGANIAFKYYTNDTSGNWNTTGVFSYVTTSVGDTCDCPASGNMVIDCSENCDIESCDLKTNNFTATGSGTVTGFKNLYNYTWGMIQCTNMFM